MKEEDLLEVASDLLDSAADYKTYEEWFAYIREYGEKLLQQSRRREKETADGVILSTMHSAKGLEYDRVFIIDANEGVTPHKKAVMEADVEEERRMFYVAMTRAKKKLYIYFTKERYHKPASMSRFVGELLADRSLFVKGARVVHKTYGQGNYYEYYRNGCDDFICTVRGNENIKPVFLHFQRTAKALRGLRRELFGQVRSFTGTLQVRDSGEVTVQPAEM